MSQYVKVRVAFRMAHRWPDRVPTWQEVVAEFRVTERTAKEYLHAMRVARGVEPVKAAAKRARVVAVKETGPATAAAWSASIGSPLVARL